jgi:ABC-type molybdate transport system substrate-binding protein
LASAGQKMHATAALLAISAAAYACVRAHAASDARNTAAAAGVTVLTSGNATSPFGQLLMAYYSGERTVSPGREVAGGG